MASPSVRDGEWGETPQQDSGSGPAFTEAQHWIEQVTGRSFGDKDFRTGLENGILLCELLNAIKPGAVKKINRLPTPIAGLDNITLFLRACEELGLKGSQLFDPGDLQDMTNRATIKVPEYSQKMKNVLITIYWLGKAANSCTSYSGPTLNLKEFEGLLSQIQKEMEDTDSPKRSIRDSGYIDSWDSERSDSLSPPRHARDDSFDSLESFGSRSQQTPSPDVVFRGSSDGRGSDSESDVTQKTPDVKRDDMSVRRSSYNEPKISLPFNQYLPNKHNHTAYMPAPLRKKQAERAENYRKSWSNTTSPVGSERPFSHPEPIEEEHSEESSQGEDFAEPSSTVSKTQVINDSKPAEKSELAPAEDAGGLENQLQACPVADTGHRTSKESARWEGKDEEEMKKLKRIQKAGITVMPASERYRRQKQQQESSGQSSPDIILRRENTFLMSYQDDSESEEEEQKFPDLEKDDFALRKAQLNQCKPKVAVNQFLARPCTKRDRELWASIKHTSRGADGASQRQEQKVESEESSKPIKGCSDVKPKSGTEIRKEAPDDLVCHKARSNKGPSPSSQRSVHFGPVTEIDQQHWEKLSISRAGPGSESEEEPDSCTIKAYTCHLLPSVSSAVVLNSQDGAVGDKAQMPARSEVVLASQTEISSKPEETVLSDICTAEYYRRSPSPVLVAHTVTINESIQDPSKEAEKEDEQSPDAEKDDMLNRRIRATSKQSSAAFNKFLPVPSSQRGQTLGGINKEPEQEVKKGRISKDESLWTYSPTVALSDDTGSVSMNDMRPEDDNLAQPHSKARHEELHKVHSRLREDQDRWQDDLARWKNRRRSASQDLIKRKEERDIVEKIMSGERNLSERRRSIKTYKEIVEEKESREKALQEAYNKAKTREEAEEILRKYSQRFIISEAVLENLEIPKFLERSQSVDSDSSCSPTKESNSLKYLRQQSLPIQKYTATVEAVITPSSQSQSNFSGVGTSPTKTIASKTVPMLTPKPYSQPKDSQTVLKSFKKDGKIRINGETSPTFTRVEESASPVSAPFLTPSQMFEGVARVDNTPLQLQTDNDSPVSQPEQLVPSATDNPQSAQAEQMELTEISVDVATTQQPSIENESDLKSTCSDPEKKPMEDAIPEEDHHKDLQTSPEPVALSGNAELNLRDTLDSKIITTDEACLTLKNEASDNSTQEQLDQEGLKSVTPQLDKTGDVLDSDQRINEVKEEAAENSQPVDIIIQQGNPSESNMTCFHTCSLGSELVDEAIMGFADSITEPSNSASVPVSVRNSWRRSEFFSQPVEVESNENSNIPVASLNLPKHSDCWFWDPEEERKRQERWQKEQERLLQERYRREHEKLRQEWEKAQKEVEEEERRYHEEERKIIQETVTPLTPRSLPIHLPSEWLSISKTEEIRNSNSTEVTDEEIKQSDPQKQNMVEIDSCQKGEEGGILAREHQSHKETTQRSTQEQEEVQSSKNRNGYEENCDKPGTNKLEKLHWQDMKQLESKEIGMNFQSKPHVFQTDEENASERQIQAHSQTHLTDHQQVSAQAAGSPVFSDRPQNAQELPLFLDLQRNKQPDDQSEMKAGSLDRSWAHQSNIVDRKNRSGSHEDLQSSQSLPQPHSSPQLQSPSRSVSGKKLCSTCGLPLGKGAAMIIETLSLYFHIQCFTCGICQGQLGDASTGTDVRIRNGLLNCNDCYIRSRTAGQPTTL
ncbi:LIM and calponin homology domains-containing protein 1-like isoform X9 [Hemitrygon akajei]|uniref:LIM and calponin homology domains-containing protein 1-like isoform X9 n=1 Tax=Hemitrygon akajei TaxID=2704970 RepID=UPI003BF9DB46